MDRVELHLRQILVNPGEPIKEVYFLEGGLCSIVTAREDEEEVEVGIFGREGMSGSALLLAAEASPHRFFMQVNGNTALRLNAGALLDACRKSHSLHAQLLRFAQVMTVQAAETAATNAHYTLPERLARWLLMCHDRMDGDQISLTHEFMATMLGVRRSGVTVTLHSLEGEGAIKTRRGMICIIDRDRLEALAGAAYGAAEAEYERLIGPLSRSSKKAGTAGQGKSHERL
ncbi:Crp/Fnr family transcriptional regulator [Allosphingosinicella flava]|uniref:Crp/Fnr family transcriptional regulator n=1 Tax=Allosphingosinicella flava TaxID=2771430 RepID=A0A7T2GJJ6_9SPHN|nr:Crp/Fnr family transcriptional regulator [Sphingosinicella flava]QPQ55035.1 Crp/Fnr family transcriptional regulator [Sphingosinicella flava]